MSFFSDLNRKFVQLNVFNFSSLIQNSVSKGNAFKQTWISVGSTSLWPFCGNLALWVCFISLPVVLLTFIDGQESSDAPVSLVVCFRAMGISFALCFSRETFTLSRLIVGCLDPYLSAKQYPSSCNKYLRGVVWCYSETITIHAYRQWPMVCLHYVRGSEACSVLTIIIVHKRGCCQSCQILAKWNSFLSRESTYIRPNRGVAPTSTLSHCHKLDDEALC